MQLGSKDEPYRAYLDLVNQKAKTFITLIQAKVLINIVDKALKCFAQDDISFDSSIKVVNVFDYKVYFIQESNQCMIVVGKFKNCGVKYAKPGKDILFRKNEIVGDQELRWSMQVIFNNLKTLFKSSNNISTESIPEVGSKSKSEMSVTDFLIPSGNDSESSEEGESNESSESVDQESDSGKYINKRYSKLMHMFNPLKNLNPNLLHSNTIFLTKKFVDHLKDTCDIQILKFLPSQYFLMIGNSKRIKIVLKHSFRDKSKEDDYTDLSQNLMFLELLNYQLHQFNKVLAKKRKANTAGEMNAYVKSTHSATKTQMLNHVYSSAIDDHKEIDDEGKADLVRQNSDCFEFIIPGYLIRLSKVEGISKMSHDDKFYSVMVFQRYIRRRRISKKEKETNSSEKYLSNSFCMLPCANLKERQIISNSFSAFIRNNLVVDSKTFLSCTLGSKFRKKTLNEVKNKSMSLHDKKSNILVVSYIQSKEVKKYKNTNKNPLNMGGHIKVAKSPFDYNETIGPENIHINFGPSNNIRPINIDESESCISGPGDNDYQEFCFESGIGSQLFEDSIDKNMEEYERSHKKLNDLKRIEKGNFSHFFDEESSIFPSEYSRGDASEDSSPHEDMRMKKTFTYKVKNKNDKSFERSQTNMSFFFDKVDQSITDIKGREGSREESKDETEQEEEGTPGTESQGFQTANENEEHESPEESSEMESSSSAFGEESSLLGKG